MSHFLLDIQILNASLRTFKVQSRAINFGRQGHSLTQ
jgi:hypothetical protein